jgi:phage terminase large subunit-like protein
MVGKWLRLAARRFLGDLKRAGKRGCPFTFDAWHANDACRFIELLPHVEGVWDTPTIRLHASHVFLLVNLFGFRKPDGTRRFTTALLAVARKNAKALALDTPIPTPGGWSTMGELKPGDQVFGADGAPCVVTATSQVYLEHECFRLDFSNGESVVADAGHLWSTSARAGGDGVRTTREIVDTLRNGRRGDRNHSLVMPAPLDCQDAELLVAPYTLGAWLGDGHSACAKLTCDRSDLEILEGIRADGWPVREMTRTAGKASTYALSCGSRRQKDRDQSLAACLRRIGVLGNKHIPAQYLRASRSQRVALLQGLMDTDGTVSKSGRVLSFTSTSERLASGVAELLASLGVKYSWRQGKLACSGRPVSGIEHRLQFMAFSDELPAFRLGRKLGRMRKRLDCSIKPRSKTVQIVDATPVPSVPVRCITVDSKDSLFLFGRTMLPTHNSTLASGIALYCLVAEGEVGPQVVAAATTGQQARIVFNVAKRMVEKTPDLREAFNLEPFANAVASYSNGGSLKPINAKASTQDGLNPSAVILDEVHAHKTHDLLNVLKSAAGARRNPLFLYTTTEGYESPGPWPEQRKFAQQVLEGVVEAEHFLALMFTVDDEDDDFDEVAWHKANPLMDVNPILLKEIRKEAIEAKQMPGRLAEFRIKRLNRPSSSAKGFIDLPRWKACCGTVPLDQLEGLPCWGALDLASTSDLTVLRLVWRMPDGRWVTHGWRWVPEDAVASRTVRGTVPYAGWVAEGLIEQTSGNVTDYAVVEARIREVVARFRPAAVAYDPWNATELVNRLTEDELPMVQFIQGPKSYHPAMQELERAYRAAQLLHGGDPVLQWCASNLVVRYDANLNMAPDKRRAAEKIDDIVALAMAVGVAMAAAPEPQTITQGFVRI